MRRLVILILSAGLWAACSGGAHTVVAPLPCGYEPGNLSDCMVPAGFSADDFRWMDGSLVMTVYSEDLYDAPDLVRMQPGDTLLYGGEKIAVRNIVEEKGLLVVNDGLDNGGAWLRAAGGGTFRAVQFDDHSLYTELGLAELPLSQDFIIIDCGEFPTDPSDTVRNGQKLYLEALADWKADFSPLNTTVLIEGGEITEINRRWIP